MRRLHFSIALCLTLAGRICHAQALEGVDQNGLPAPLQPSPFAAIEPSEGLQGNDSFHYGLRSTLLLVPLSMSAPSADPDGTVVPLSEGVLLGEFVASYGLGRGWDLGLGFGAHFLQWGKGNRAANGTDEGLPHSGLRDPRLGIGFTQTYRNLSARPFFVLSVPLGGAKALAGENGPREKLGATVSWRPGHLTWSSEISLLFRKRVELSSTTWGTQLQVATGVAYEVFQFFAVAAEAHLSPVLTSQEDRSGRAGGVLLPAEAIGSIRYETKRWGIACGAGTGLPLSTISAENVNRGPVRGPTAPLLRGFLQWTLHHH